MKNILPIVFLSFILITSSCNNQQENEQSITKKGSIENLEQVIEKLSGEERKITPTVALNAIIDIYKLKAQVSETNEKPIDLYVIYDSAYWAGNRESETFEITFAHQVVEESNGPLYEYRITLIYDTKPFEGIKEFDLRYPRDKDNLNSYKEAIEKSNGFKKASSIEVKRIEIIKEET